MQKSLKILYGVQATGQGHITRARVLGPALQNEGAEVDFLLSGRKPHEFFDMDEFGAYRVCEGLTFAFSDGQVHLGKTLVHNNLSRFARDIYTLDLSGYDLVITDYEPVTAWAAKLKSVPSLGIGHNYVFKHAVPTADFNKASLLVTRHFASADCTLPMHWHHFGQNILPPMLPLPEAKGVEEGKIVVYLNFENLDQVVQMVSPLAAHGFFIYSSKVDEPRDEGHVKLRPVSASFRNDLETCEGVICGAGFELPSEAIHMGKKLLVKALKGQPEQSSNALALSTLGLGSVMTRLDTGSVQEWLARPVPKPVVYPDTAPQIADWIVNTDRRDVTTLSKMLWSQVRGLDLS